MGENLIAMITAGNTILQQEIHSKMGISSNLEIRVGCAWLCRAVPGPAVTRRKESIPQNRRMDPLPYLVTIPEAGKQLSVSRRTVYRLIDDGKLKRVYPRPKAARITSSSLTQYLDGLKQPEQAAPRDSISQGIKARADVVLERFGLKKR